MTTTTRKANAVPVCQWCGGAGTEPAEEATTLRCGLCNGSGYQMCIGDLGPTRAHKRRPFTFDVGTRTLTVTRGRKVERYRITELPVGGHFHGRGWEVAKQSSGEVRHVYVGREGCDCDCEGKTYEATARGDRLAWERGEGPTGFHTLGCVHLDAVRELLTLGYLDVACDAPTDPAVDPFS